MTKAFKFTHNNFVIQVDKPDIEHIKASVELLSFFMPKDFIDEVIEIFTKKLANHDYEIVEREDKDD